jgi:hypothetical protein
MLKLLPHHVASINHYISLRQSSPLEDIDERTRNERIRGVDFAVGIDSIINQIEKNPSMIIKIVSESDDICNLCRFINTCREGDYSELNKAKIEEVARMGGKMEIFEHTPNDFNHHKEVALNGEKHTAKLLEIEIGKTYEAKEILFTYMPFAKAF